MPWNAKRLKEISPNPSFPKRGIGVSPFEKGGSKGDFLQIGTVSNITTQSQSKEDRGRVLRVSYGDQDNAALNAKS